SLGRTRATDAGGGAREQLRQLTERALGLRDRPHLEPVTEQHDGYKRRQFFPEWHAWKAKYHRQAECERDTDRERNQRHHAGQAIPDLADGTRKKWCSAVQEHRAAEYRRNPPRTRNARRRVSERILKHVAPDQRRKREQERQQEPVAEHGHAVTGVFVVTGVCRSMVAIARRRTRGGVWRVVVCVRITHRQPPSAT